MNLQRIRVLIIMQLKKLIREPAILFMILIFPAVLTLTFGISFPSIINTLSFGFSFPDAVPTLTLGITFATSIREIPTLTLGISIPTEVITLTFGTEAAADFNAMVPGLFVFASIFMIMTVAMSFSTDRQEGLLKRLNTTPMTSGEFMGSHVISKMLTAILQTIIIFILALLVGFRPDTEISGILLAFGIMALFSLSSVGLGLITATISKTPETAVGISFVFIIPQMFFGTIIPLSESTGLIAQILPSFYATDALKSIFGGALLTNVNILLDLTFIAIVSVVIIIVGIQLFEKYGKA